MTPDQIAKNGSEHAIQSALFAWAAVAENHGFEIADLWAETNDAKAILTSKKQGVPELRWLHAVPNGGSRGDNEKSRKIRGGQMKAEGLRDGVADIFWPVPRFPFPGLYIEMKTPTGAIRPSQREFRTFVMSQGYAHSYERSWRSAAELIKFYYAQDARFQQKDK